MAVTNKRLAAIDMGSNSFHLVLAEVSMRGFYPKPRIVARYKHKVRLADGFNTNFQLDPSSIARAENCLQGFSDQLKRFKPDAVRAVATAALRKSSNQADIIPGLEQALGYSINVISGETEAALIFAGVCAAAEQQGPILVIDIGGASTEVIVGRPLKPELLKSLDMGCVVFQNNYFSDQKLTSQYFNAAIDQARSQIASYGRQYQQIGWEQVLGASGTFRALAEVALAEGQTALTRAWLKSLIERCIKAGAVNKLSFAGLREDRKAILAGGISILYGLLLELDIEQFGVTNGALREGLLAELAAEVTA
ncbi:MAG: Ppx/GppA family phosphatase [Pseudomonadota bacterium]